MTIWDKKFRKQSFVIHFKPIIKRAIQRADITFAHHLIKAAQSNASRKKRQKKSALQFVCFEEMTAINKNKQIFFVSWQIFAGKCLLRKNIYFKLWWKRCLTKLRFQRARKNNYGETVFFCKLLWLCIEKFEDFIPLYLQKILNLSD